MTYQEIVEKAKPEIQQVFEFFKMETMKIQTNRLLPSLVENIEVDFAGSKMPLKGLGAVSSLSSRELLFQPWDRIYLEPAAKALERAGLGLSPVVDQNKIRLVAPLLTGEHRENLLKILSQKLNDSLQGLRRARDKAWKELQEREKAGEIREDDKFKGKEKLEEVAGEFKKKIEEAAENKRKEIEG